MTGRVERLESTGIPCGTSPLVYGEKVRGSEQTPGYTSMVFADCGLAGSAPPSLALESSGQSMQPQGQRHLPACSCCPHCPPAVPSDRCL